MAGLIASIGGLTESVSKDSLDALLKYANFLRVEGKVEIIGSSIVGLMARDADNVRMFNACLKALTHLFRTRALDDVLTGIIGSDLVSIVQQECTSGTDVRRLILAVNVSTCLLTSTHTLSPTLQKTCWGIFGLFLVHAYPRVRSYAAEQLYMVLLQDSSREGDVLDLVLETPWACHDRAVLEGTARRVTDLLLGETIL